MIKKKDIIFNMERFPHGLGIRGDLTVSAGQFIDEKLVEKCNPKLEVAEHINHYLYGEIISDLASMRYEILSALPFMSPDRGRVSQLIQTLIDKLSEVE